jgi:hypothetical protein
VTGIFRTNNVKERIVRDKPNQRRNSPRCKSAMVPGAQKMRYHLKPHSWKGPRLRIGCLRLVFRVPLGVLPTVVLPNFGPESFYAPC